MAKHFTWCLKRTYMLTNRLNIYKQSVPALKTIENKIQFHSVSTPQPNQINLDYDEPQDYDSFLLDSKRNKGIVVETLIRMLSIARETAAEAVDDYPNFRLLTKKVLLANFQLLREGGFYKSTIKDSKYLLTDDTETLKKKIAVAKKLDLDINETAALFNLSLTKFISFEKKLRMEASYWPCSNRILYLAEKLQCNPATICTLLTFNPDIMRTTAPRLLSTTEYLLEVGMAPEHILNDMQVYCYAMKTIQQKVERARLAGVHPLKPWIIRCTDDLWGRLETRLNNQKGILAPGQSVKDYVREIFDCDMKVVDHFFVNDPKLLKMDIALMSKILIFLRDEGFKIEEITRAPSIMHRNYETTKKRFDMWKSVSSRQPSLFIFNQVPSRFQYFLETERARIRDKQKT